MAIDHDFSREARDEYTISTIADILVFLVIANAVILGYYLGKIKWRD